VTENNDLRVDVVVPPIGYAEMRVGVWLAEPGDRVYAGDRIVEVLAQGVTCDISAPAAGRLAEQLAFAGDVVRPGQVVGVVTADAE
jgi:pyruvate/2-oxoglutarate dehydrogenase complex dihydrolipoamide acyltransferase (E2) component